MKSIFKKVINKSKKPKPMGKIYLSEVAAYYLLKPQGNSDEKY